MRRKFRERAAPPKETANPMPVLFPDSFNRSNLNRPNQVRLNRLLCLDQRSSYTMQTGSIDFDDGLDTKGVRIVTYCLTSES